MRRNRAGLVAGLLLAISGACDMLGTPGRGTLSDPSLFGTLFYGMLPFALGIGIVAHEAFIFASSGQTKE